jgi:hypothetical protein
MNEKTQTPSETVSLAAAQAAKIVNIATAEAKKLVDTATEAASLSVDKEHAQEYKMVNIISRGLREVFGENEEAQRFIDVKRIPLICKSILDMHDNIKEIKDNFITIDQDHEARLRSIERNMWKWIGALMIVPPVVTIGIAYIISLFTRH